MNTVSFGRRQVEEQEKEHLVRAVFDSVAPQYDLMNDLMSAGIHRIWKSVLLDRLAPQPGQTLLDVAGGTGDIAEGFLARAAARNPRGRSPATAIVMDINHSMLVAGAERTKRPEDKTLVAEDGSPLLRVCGNAEELPFPDRSVDKVTIAFGIRNVTRRAAALAEVHRVLKTGGQFICLEFSRPITATMEKLYYLYADNMIPRLGAWVAKDRDSYDYLVESIKRFPPQDAFALEVQGAGFQRVKVENMSAGVASLHSGWKY